MALSTTQYGYIIDPMVPFTDGKGKTVKDGFVRVFVAGSSTPVVTYRNFDGATNQDRIELDNSGRTKTSVIGSKGLTYKVCVYDKHHSQESPILTVDKVSVIGANITAGTGATVVTGLDGLTTKPNGFVDASVVGTDGYVAIDHTLVTDDLDTDAKVTAVEDDRYIPLLNDDVNDPDSKMTLGRLWQWALGKIKSLSTTITAFRTGDVIPVDGPSGPAKMSKDSLLAIAARNAVDSGVAADATEFAQIKESVESDETELKVFICNNSIDSTRMSGATYSYPSVTTTDGNFGGFKLQQGKKYVIAIKVPASAMYSFRVLYSGSWQHQFFVAQTLTAGTIFTYTYTPVHNGDVFVFNRSDYATQTYEACAYDVTGITDAEIAANDFKFIDTSAKCVIFGDVINGRFDGLDNKISITNDRVTEVEKDIGYDIPITLTWKNGFYINNGFEVPDGGIGYSCTDYIDVKEGWTIHTNTSTNDNSGYSFYTAKDESTRFDYVNGQSCNGVVVPSGAKYIRLSTKESQLPSSAAWFALYWNEPSSVDKRLDYCEATIEPIPRIDKALGIPISSTIVWEDGYYINNGWKIAGANWNCTDYIEVTEGLKIQCNTITTGTTGYSFYTAKDESTRFDYDIGSPNGLIVPTGAKYIRFTMRVGQIDKSSVYFRQVDADPSTMYNTLAKDDTELYGIYSAIGDSVTEGAGATDPANCWMWKLRQKLISDRFIKSSANLGSGGNNSNGITAYSGGRGLYITSPVTIPASGGVTISLSARVHNAGGSCNVVNPCYLGGVKGTLTYSSSTYTFTRASYGDARDIPEGEPLITSAANYALRSSFLTIMIGCNDGNPITDAIADGIIANAKRCAGLSKNGKYLVMGHYTTKDSSDYLINLYRENFGQRFVDVYGYLSSNGVNDAVALGILPTGSLQSDWFSLFVTNDNIHPNDAGHAMIYYCIYSRMRELGWM